MAAWSWATRMIAAGLLATSRAFRWTAATGMVALVSPTGTQTSRAAAISGDGEWIYGSITLGINSLLPMRWSAQSGMTTPYGAQPNERKAVAATNWDGSSVVLNSPVVGETRRWTSSGGFSALPGPGNIVFGNRLRVLDMDRSGRVVVGEDFQFSTRAFRWTASGGRTDLSTELTYAGVTSHLAWNLLDASGVSGDGTRMVGMYRNHVTGNPPFIQGAYLARLPYPELGVNYCSQPVANSTGLRSEIRAQGSFVASDNDLSMVFSQLPPGQFGLLLNGTDTGALPGAGGSLGTLCVAGSIGRYRSSVFVADAAGDALVTLDLQATPTPQTPIMVLAGQTWHFQAWHRDQVSGPASNFTDAVSVNFY